MKKLLAISLGICLLGLVTPSFTFAKGKKAAKKAAASENSLSKYDTNKDGSLDVEEVKAVQKDYADNKTEALKKYDTNNDGKIDADEAAAIKADFAAGAKKHHKKKGA